jgi:hypothetical protein
MELIYETGNSGCELATNLFAHSGKIKGDMKSAKTLQGEKIRQLSKGLKNV